VWRSIKNDAWPHNKLHEIVQQIAEHQNAQVPDLEATIAKATAELGTAKLANHRAAMFPTTGEPHCPNCWMEGTDALVVQIESEIGRLDMYRCHRCKSEYPLEREI
jgi:hypothetical protein